MDLESEFISKKKLSDKLKSKEAFAYIFQKNGYYVPPKALFTWEFIQGFDIIFQ